MKQAQDERKKLSQLAGNIPPLFNIAGHFVRQGDVRFSKVLLAEIFKTMNEAIAVLQAAAGGRQYVDVLIANRMKNWWEDEKAVSGPLDAEEIGLIYSRLEIYIALLLPEIRRFQFQSAGSMFKKWFAAGWKPVLGIFTVIAIAFSIKTFIDKGRGLTGSYFRNADLTELHAQRRDPNIDFNWQFGSPLWGFKVDHFSARWEGYLKAPKDGEYELITKADDGVRLWIDEKLVIDDWKSHPETTTSARINLTEGKHALRLEYFDDFASAKISLLWKYGNTQAVPIPSKYLSPEND